MFPLSPLPLFHILGQQASSTERLDQRAQRVATKTLVPSSPAPSLKSRSWARLIRCLFHLLIDKLFYGKFHRTPLPEAEANTQKAKALRPREDDTSSEMEEDDNHANALFHELPFAQASDAEDLEDEDLVVIGEEVIDSSIAPNPRNYFLALTVLNSPEKRLGADAFITCCQALGIPENHLQLSFLAPSHAQVISQDDEELQDKIALLPKDLPKIALPVVLSNQDEHIVQIFIDVHQKKLELFDPTGRAAKDDPKGTRKIRGMHVDLATFIIKLAKHYEITTVHENTEQYQKDWHSCGHRGLLATHLFLSGATECPATGLTNKTFNESLFRQSLFERVHAQATHR